MKETETQLKERTQLRARKHLQNRAKTTVLDRKGLKAVEHFRLFLHQAASCLFSPSVRKGLLTRSNEEPSKPKIGR